jgi:hypothetical protein
MKVYVVFGAAGDYEDYQEWAVVAYLSEPAAKQHVKDAGDAAHAIYMKFADRDRERQEALPDDKWRQLSKRRNRFDPKHEANSIKWGDVHYFYYVVEVADAPNLSFGRIKGSPERREVPRPKRRRA